MRGTASDAHRDTWHPLTPEDKALVEGQLARILASPLFKQSKRYSPFLRFVVEKSLAGEGGSLKERTLGVEVFGRSPDYDSNNDPIVRITAGEVRRRIAQYYHEPGHDQELRIELSPGSYLPEFIPLFVPPQQTVPDAGLLTEATVPLRDAKLGRRKMIGGTALLFALIAAFLLVQHLRTQRISSIDSWWQPALHSTSPVLLSVGTTDSAPESLPIPSEPSSSPEAQTLGDHVRQSDQVGLIDAVALEKFASLLSSHMQAYRTLSSASTKYSDLRSGPTVLLSGLDNSWTMRVTDPLRFHFVLQSKSMVAVIEDRQHPDSMQWRVDFSQPYSHLTKDYAILARLHDIFSDKPVFVAAGIGSNGTAAAAEFVTSESDLQTLISRLPANWQEKNVEAVLQTTVIGGQAGPPVLVSLQVW